jgi:hypothetical protein
MKMQEDTRACMGIQGHTLMRGSPQEHADVYMRIQGDHHYVELPTVVHDGMRLVWSPGNYSPWMSMDEFLVKPLGLTKAYDTSHFYIQLHVFLLAFPNTFIMYNNIGEDSQLHGTWRVIR